MMSLEPNLKALQRFPFFGLLPNICHFGAWRATLTPSVEGLASLRCSLYQGRYTAIGFVLYVAP